MLVFLSFLDYLVFQYSWFDLIILVPLLSCYFSFSLIFFLEFTLFACLHVFHY